MAKCKEEAIDILASTLAKSQEELKNLRYLELLFIKEMIDILWVMKKEWI